MNLFYAVEFVYNGFVRDVNLPVTLYFLRSRWHLLHAFQIAYTLYWKLFQRSGFLSNLCLPWKKEFAQKIVTVLNILFIIQDFSATCTCPEKQSCPEIFHCIEIFFVIKGFWATCACHGKQSCPEIFQTGGGGSPPRLVRLWTYYKYLVPYSTSAVMSWLYCDGCIGY